MMRKGLYGMVVCGGQSTRMGTDKSEIVYYKKPQREHVSDMLRIFCEKVFVSCNSNQAGRISNPDSLLIDLPEFSNIGPMAALLTANTVFPENDFLVLACDYPFIDAEDLDFFLQTINEKSFTAAFYNDKDSVYEPLIAWYSKESLQKIKNCFYNQQFSLQRFLKESNAQQFKPIHTDHLKSVDTPEDSFNAKRIISTENDFKVCL
ncbi:NTP transferase domain-containing protein [Dyadobacter flavalbus]|uniref:NTP transferase domain-containing protein n=1 Tax=Dyadobacter flavalbus TaxID=2579942 RepID=A0A5M8QWR5_9BACT|nr:NTP transferase domain-containing protein [Dyadobacter flavalbus]KAA6439791.1 NTP transferase domain-containing protein [Dyadobacter flavalbus]